MKFDAFVAGRYLKAKRKQAFIGVISLITLIGITLGVASLNIALSIHNGMRGAFIRSLVGETGNMHILSTAYGNEGFSAEELRTTMTVLARYPSLEATALMRQEGAVIFSETRRLQFTKLQGVFPDEFLATSDRLRRLEAGSVAALEERPTGAPPGIILGYDLARDLNVKTGDEVRIAVARLTSAGLSGRTDFRRMKCQVVGIFKSGNSQFDKFDAYVHIKTVFQIMGTSGVQSVLLRFNSIEAMDKAKRGLQESTDLPILSTVVDFRDLNQSLLHALNLEKMATTLVIGLFILIVALNMVSALIMLVMEKHHDIGIMKSFGTPNKTILKIYIRQGMTLSMRGTLLGTILGVAFAKTADATRLIKLDNNVYEVLNYLPFVVKWPEVLLVAIFSLLLALVTSIYPAWQAANLDPVEALKYD